MSWRWSACAEENGGAACKAIVFASSLNPVSAEGYRFSSKAGAPFVAGFEESYRKMDAMPCDILISAHPDNAGPGRYSDMPGACRAYEIGRDTSELQSLMRSSYAVFCLKKKQHISDHPQQIHKQPATTHYIHT